MASRPRSSLASTSGLPTPGGAVSARRKSGLPSPGGSPSKSSKRASANEEIAARMSELQAAIRSKDPASYGASGRRSALGASTTTVDEDEVEMLQPLTDQSPPAFASPRPIRRIPSSGSAFRPTPQSSLKSHNQHGSDGQTGTPTSTPGPAASLVRPGSSLSSSSYMSAHAASDSRAKSPIPPDVPVTPAKRTSDTLAPVSARLTRTVSNVSSTSSFRTAVSSVYRASEGYVNNTPQVGDRVKAAGMEGMLRYVGEVQGKPGTWAGVELVGEYVGRGKNDGAVQGLQYFACPPNCGIFAQLSKVQAFMPAPSVPTTSPPTTSVTRRTYSRPSSALSTAGSSAGPTPRKPLPRPSGSLVPPSTIARKATKSSNDASEYATSQITAGSRASSYLNLTAKQLQERKSQSTTTSTSESPVLRSPRKSGVLSNSTASVFSTGGPTPKAVRTTGRPNGVVASSRKSIGTISGAGTTVRRPGSSMRSHTPDVPSVPPLPTGVTSNGTGAATPARRYSNISRPSTPSGRPSSRLSNAASVSRSVSRASSRASMLSGPSRLGVREDEDAEETLQTADQASLQDLQAARESLNKARHEAEQAKLELLELTSDFRDEQKKTKSLQLEVDELKRKAADSRLDQASAVDERHAEKEQQAAELLYLKTELEAARQEAEETKRAQASLTSELDQGHELLARLQEERDASAKEAKSLASQLDELQKAGRAMVDLYEDKFQNLEEEFQSTQDALQAREKQLQEMQEEIERQHSLLAKRNQTSLDMNSTDALLAASLGAGRPLEQQESALAIENDDLRAELAHVKKRMASLEEQSYDKTVEFEALLEKEKCKRQENVEIIEKLKNEVKESKERFDRMRMETDRYEQRVHELEVALRESQQTLETERVELESLRKEQQSSSTSVRNDELAHLRSALTVAQHEKKDREREITKLKSNLDALQEELKLMEEIREEVTVDGSGDDAPENAKLHAEIREKNAKINELEHELSQGGARGLPRISTQPTDTDTIPTPMQHSFSQHLSPHHQPTSPKESPSSSRSSSARKNRDSTTSVQSNTSLSSLTSLGSNHRRGSLKDESSMMKDEIEGLKILLRQAEAENSKLQEKFVTANEEASKLKDGQKALESTVNDLVEQLEAYQAGKGQSGQVTMPILPPRTSSHELLEAEVKELKGTLARLEKEYKKDKENLNSEVVQLELLIEAKIFREGELESQLEDVRRALAEAKRASSHASASSKLSNGELPRARNYDSPRRNKSTVKPDRGPVSSLSSPNGKIGNGESVPSGRRSASQYGEEDLDDGLCEICKENHAVENCPIFGGSSTSDHESSKKGSRNTEPAAGDSDAPYCDDCEEYGHDLANCPLADEIF